MNRIASQTQGRTKVNSWQASGILQRKCACGNKTIAGGECEACGKERLNLQRRAAGNRSEHAEVPSIVHDVLRSPGQPLDAETRAFMEPRFGHDFSGVQVHTDAKAAESAQAVNALAYTVGRNVVFGPGQYAPRTGAGRKLVAHELAHELAHVVQEHGGQSGRLQKQADSGPTGSATEEQADRAATQITEGAAEPAQANDSGSCTPTTVGVPPTVANCSAYLSNIWWLPLAYVNNSTCACLTTPNSRTANCVRKFLQDRLAATPGWLKALAAVNKVNDVPFDPVRYIVYQTFVQAALAPRIYQDHVDAYRNCCCPSGPAPYVTWIGVTSVPIQPCTLVGLTIRYFGSCHGTPGAW